MSAIHEQAMNYVYQQVLQRLQGHFSRPAMVNCAARRKASA